MGIGNDLLEEGDRIDAIEAGRDAIDGEGVAAEIGEVETDSREAGESLLKNDTLSW